VLVFFSNRHMPVLYNARNSVWLRLAVSATDWIN